MTMSFCITDEILAANARAGGGLIALSAKDSADVRDQLALLYGSGEVGRSFSYQTLRQFSEVYFREGWRLVPEILGKGEALFFLNPDQGFTVWRCASTEWLIELLADCYGFPFYAASLDLSSLFCFDDHDRVLVCGVAVDSHIVREGLSS